MASTLDIIDWFEQGHTVVTPTRQLARYLSDYYANEQIKRGQRSWVTPECLHWAAFTNRLWQQIDIRKNDSKVLLNHIQQRYLWAQIIQRSDFGKDLLHQQTTISNALAAYKLCQQWQIPIFSKFSELGYDAQAFVAWVEIYKETLNRHNWIDPDSLIHHLDGFLNTTDKAIALTLKNIVFYGFDSLNPQQQTLIAVLEKMGLSVRQVVPTKFKRANVHFNSFCDIHAELTACAYWAQQKINEHPGCRVGVVMLDMQYNNRQVHAVFQSVLHPQSWEEPDNALPQYAIARGQPLSDYPVIYSALNLLQIMLTYVSIHEISFLLRSKFIGGYEKEAGQRSQLDARLRTWQAGTLFDLTSFLTISRSFEIPCSDLLARLQSAENSLKALQSKQTVANWMRSFSDFLQQLGWPGVAPLQSATYQSIKAWHGVLEEVSTLGVVADLTDGIGALELLSGVVKKTLFQAQTGSPPIQILGVNGASALQFDYLWLAGGHAAAWPPEPNPVPFIPIELQRQAGIPHSSTQHAHDMAYMLTQKLIYSSPDVRLSCPQKDNSKPLRASSLLTAWIRPEKIDSIPDGYLQSVYRTRQLESFEDNNGPPLGDRSIIKGGTSFFKDQANCPFKGFVKHRLQATKWPESSLSLTAITRGILLHQGLYQLWHYLSSSKGLKKILPNKTFLIEIAEQAFLAKESQKYLKALPDGFFALEKERLIARLDNWLEVEANREEAFTCHALEQSYQVDCFGIQMTIKIDRIDKLYSGDYLLIDYKSGVGDLKAWDKARLTEPQLPLYLLAMKDTPIIALAFANLKAGHEGYTGYAKGTDLLPSMHLLSCDDWHKKQQQWAASLSQIAMDIKTGDARVMPSQGSCRYCDLKNFCRIYEA